VKDVKNHKDLVPLVVKVSNYVQIMYNEVKALERVHKYASEHIEFEDVMISVPWCYA